MTDIAKLNIEINSQKAVQAKTDLDQLTRSGQLAEKGMGSLSAAAKRLGAALASAFAIQQVVSMSLTAFSTFDKGLIGVQKTTGMTDDQIKSLGISISKMSLEVPVSTGRLLELAEAAGQLGVKGSKNIEIFTETMAKLETASDVVGEEGAKAIARLLNVTGEAIDTVPRFGAVLVALGNASAASENEILSLASEIGQATSVFSVTAADAAALGAAMRSIGVQAELGGSSVGRSMRTIEAAIQSGGDQMKLLMDVTQMTEDQLRETFERNATVVFQKWIEGIGRLVGGGRTAASVLEDFGLKGEEVLKVLPAMAQNSRLLADSLAISNAEVENATALNEEAIAASRSFSAQMGMAKNAIDLIAASIGAGLAPVIVDVVGDFRDWVEVNENFLRQDVPEHVRKIADDLLKIVGALSDIKVIYDALPSEVVGPGSSGLVGYLLFGKTGAVLGLAANLIPAIANIIRAIDQINKGNMSVGEFAGMNADDLADFLDELEEKSRKVYYAIDENTEGFDKYSEATRKAEVATGDLAGATSNLAGNANKLTEAMKKAMAEQAAWEHEASIKAIQYAEEARQKYWQESIETMNEMVAREKEAWEKLQDEKADAAKKALEEQSRAEEEARREYEREWERVYDDMHEFAADTFYDIFDGQLDSFEDFADSMLDVFKRMLANMAAEAAMTNIFKPMMNQMAGSALGSVFGLPSLYGPGSSGVGALTMLPGMGWLGATIPGTAILGSELGWGAAAAQDIGVMASPGVTWGSALGAGALGGLGYSTLGSAIGLPTSGYSGLTAGLGAAGMSAYGGSLAGLTGIGALGGPIGIGLGALAGGLLGGLFGSSDPTPALGIQGGLSSAPGRNPADFYDSRFFNWTVFEQDLSADAAIAIRDYFDNYFLQIDTAVNGALKETFKKYDAGAVNRGWVYTEGSDEGQIINAISDTVFKGILEGLKAESLGAGFEAFDVEFFESIKTEGQDLFQAYVGFYDVVSNTQNFLEDFTRRVDDLGQASVEAYQQIQLVSGVLAEMDMAIEQITGSAVIGQINALSDTWDAYIDVMKQAQASAEQLTEAEAKRNLVVGSQVTGLNVNSIAQAIKSGSSVDAIVSKAMGDLVAEKMAQEMFDEMVPVVEEAGRIWSETGGNIDAVTDYLRSMGYQFEDTMSVFSDSMESARDALDAAIGKEEQLINARLDAAVKIDTLLVDLMGGSQAPVQSMEFFERRYEQLLAEAQGATTAEEINSSVDALTGFVSQYLDFAGAYSEQDYNTLFNKITSDLRSIEYAQISEAEKQIRELESINNILQDTAGTVLDIYSALGQYLQAAGTTSEYFNEAKYMQNKVDQLNQIGFEGKSWDLASTYAAFEQAGLTPLEHYLRYGKDEGLMPFADGGISTGPSSGYPIMAHNTEAHVPLKSGSIPVEISGPGTIPNVNLKIFIGNKEIKDFQVEVINTDPEAQRAIRRVANG